MLINITGGDGVGKSTQIERLASWLEAEIGCPVRLATKGEVLDTALFPEGRMFGCPYRVLAEEIVNDMQGFSRSQFFYYLSAAQICRRPPAPVEIVVADGFWAKNCATEAALGIDLAWLEAVGAAFPEPDVTVLLDMAPERILPRGLIYKPYECGFADASDDKSFVANQNRVRAALLDMAGRRGWRSSMLIKASTRFRPMCALHSCRRLQPIFNKAHPR